MVVAKVPRRFHTHTAEEGSQHCHTDVRYHQSNIHTSRLPRSENLLAGRIGSHSKGARVPGRGERGLGAHSVGKGRVGRRSIQVGGVECQRTRDASRPGED